MTEWLCTECELATVWRCLQDVSTAPVVEPAALGMVSRCLGVIQMCLRANAEDEYIVVVGSAFLHTLSELFIEESGQGLERYARITVAALTAAAAAGGIVKQLDRSTGPAGDGAAAVATPTVQYIRRDAKPRVVTAEPPAEYVALTGSLPALLRIARNLDPNGAIGSVPLPVHPLHTAMHTPLCSDARTFFVTAAVFL